MTAVIETGQLDMLALLTDESAPKRDRLISAAAEVLGGDLMSQLAGIFERMDWAEDEIKRAQRRDRKNADLIWHAFRVLTPTHDLMSTEMVYRAHCRELIARVAKGQDTRPGTAAEICCACHDASMIAPLTDSAFGLYARMWKAAGFTGEQFDMNDMAGHYESLRGTLIDDLEREARRKTSVADRKRGDECGGLHHGEPVTCRLAKTAAIAA